jgi:hypothetical protein
MGVAREQGGAELPLEIVVYRPAQDVDRQITPFGCVYEAAAAYAFQKNPNHAPIGEGTAEGCLVAFLARNAPFQRQTHP